MVVRILWRAPGVAGWTWPSIALAVGSLLAPLALLAFTIAFWAFAVELDWAGDFLFGGSLLAHWQVWLAIAALLLVVGRLLAHLGSSENSIE